MGDEMGDEIVGGADGAVQAMAYDAQYDAAFKSPPAALGLQE